MRQRIDELCEHGKDMCTTCAKKEHDETMRAMTEKMKAEANDIWRKLILREARAIQRQKTNIKL